MLHCWKTAVPAHDLARSFQSWNSFIPQKHRPFCRVIPGTISSCSEGPRACLSWGDGGAGEHQPCVPLHSLWSSLHLGTEVSRPAGPGSAEPRAEEPLPPALRAGALGRRLRPQGGAGPGPALRVPAGAAQLLQSRGGGAHGGGR